MSQLSLNCCTAAIFNILFRFAGIQGSTPIHFVIVYIVVDFASFSFIVAERNLVNAKFVY